MSKKYPNYINDLETVELTIEQLAEELKERKAAEKERKVNNFSSVTNNFQ